MVRAVNILLLNLSRHPCQSPGVKERLCTETQRSLTAHTKMVLSAMAAERGRSCAPVAVRRVPKRVERVAVLQGRPVGLSKATVCGTSGPRLHARRTVAFTGPHWGRHHAGRTVGEDAVCSLQTPRSPFMSEKDRKKEREWKKREGKKAG